MNTNEEKLHVNHLSMWLMMRFLAFSLPMERGGLVQANTGTLNRERRDEGHKFIP